MPHPLSSQYLYHFTPKLEYLAGILADGFQHRKMHEDVPLTGYSGDVFSFPGIVRHVNSVEAVCFCDIPEHSIHTHSNQYGAFGISMTKEWGMRNGVTPIRYIHYTTPDIDNDSFHSVKDTLSMIRANRSNLCSIVSHILHDSGQIEKISQDDFDQLPEKFKKVWQEVNRTADAMMRLPMITLALSRTYKGDWDDRVTGETVERVFYDEKEWRSITMSNSHPNLIFGIDDIQNVILPSESSKDELVNLFSQHSQSMVSWELIQPKIKLLSELSA